MDSNLPGYSVHGIFQARILEWVAIFPSPEDLPDPGIKPVSPALAGIFFTTEPPGKPFFLTGLSKLFEFVKLSKSFNVNYKFRLILIKFQGEFLRL